MEYWTGLGQRGWAVGRSLTRRKAGNWRDPDAKFYIHCRAIVVRFKRSDGQSSQLYDGIKYYKGRKKTTHSGARTHQSTIPPPRLGPLETDGETIKADVLPISLQIPKVYQARPQFLRQIEDKILEVKGQKSWEKEEKLDLGGDWLRMMGKNLNRRENPNDINGNRSI